MRRVEESQIASTKPKLPIRRFREGNHEKIREIGRTYKLDEFAIGILEGAVYKCRNQYLSISAAAHCSESRLRLWEQGSNIFKLAVSVTKYPWSSEVDP